MRIGFIGLGNMGSGMAANLLSAGHDVGVFNRSPGKAAALTERGAIAAPTIAAVCDAEVVVTMLADDTAVEAVSFGAGGIIESLAAGAVHVSASTISVALAERLTAAHADAAQAFVSAPVFGRPEAAAAAKLFVVAAGPADQITSLQPVFEALGQRTFAVSDEPKIASVIESLGEAMALVGKAGMDKQAFLELLTSTLFDAPAYRVYGGLLADEKFEPAGFAAHLGLKDARLMLAAGEQLEVPLPVASLIRDRFLTLLAGGGRDLDWAALGAVATWEAGGPKPGT